MSVYQFNKVIYKGNINFDFYLFCLKKDIKLIRFILFNFWYFILSYLFSSRKHIYEIRRYRYLKYVNNLNLVIKEFYNKKSINDSLVLKKDIVIDRVPTIFMKHILKSSKVIGYDLDSNYDVNITKYNEDILKVKKCSKIYLRNSRQLNHIVSDEINIVFLKKFKHISKRRIRINYKILQVFIIFVLSFIITCISFAYTNYIIDSKMIVTYFEPVLFFMNFLPIFLIMLLFFIIFRRVHLSFLIVSALILILGIANQTKILYRDDIVKFEDITLLKEAATMSTRYEIFIKWYSIAVILFILVVFFLLKKYIRNLKLVFWKSILFIILIVCISLGAYRYLYKNKEIYDSLGDESLINQWITTRQYQIRGLIYPFICTIEDGIIKKPSGYIAEDVVEILSDYEYQDISDDKKVNVIAIMLEAYNDFSKFDTINFNEDIYAKFHEIQSNSISGTLVSSIFGGGTIVTERNFLTGYYEFPTFRGVTNSYVWYFKEQGYRTEAMHPIYGAFYNRASVNINIGFDEYYYYENKFSKINDSFMMDNEFFDYIIDGYEQSRDDDVPYFNFSVTYQNHGPYNGESYEGKEYYFANNGYDEVAYNTINEYFSGIEKTNEAIDKLINYFDNEEEPVIVILFGDHNPYLGENAIGYTEFGIDLSMDSVDGFLNYYETPYIIHANDSAKDVFNKSFVGEGNTISPMFLMNELFDYCGLGGNEYLQYMSNLKQEVDVINPYYNKENGEFVLVDDSNYKNKILEYSWVNYYESQRKR